MAALSWRVKSMGRQTDYEPRDIDDQIDDFDELGLL